MIDDKEGRVEAILRQSERLRIAAYLRVVAQQTRVILPDGLRMLADDIARGKHWEQKQKHG